MIAAAAGDSDIGEIKLAAAAAEDDDDASGGIAAASSEQLFLLAEPQDRDLLGIKRAKCMRASAR